MQIKDASEVRSVDLGAASDTQQANSSAVTTTDKVSTGATAQVDSVASAARQAVNDDRGIQLASIQAAIQQGTFQPDPARIAARILDDADVTAMLQVMLNK
jgi:negative regulator of flagellin synthesis FlgM